MFNNKKLEYITVRYDCSDELAERICADFNIEENSGSFVCINCLLTDDYSRFVSFDLYYKPNYKKLMFVNFIDIRKMYSVKMFNLWMKAVNMFDEIYDTHSQVEEYRPHIQNKVKYYKIKENKEVEDEFLKIRFAREDYNIPNVYNYNIQDHTSFYKDTLINLFVYFDKNFENVKTGRFCSFGHNIIFRLNTNHNIKNISTHHLDYKYRTKGGHKSSDVTYKGDVVFGNDIWVGDNATFLPNVHVGDGAIIGTNTVVAKDIPPYAIAVGNPARVVKYRFSKKQIKALLKIKWWDWPLYQVYDNIDLIDSEDVDKLIKEFGKKK